MPVLVLTVDVSCAGNRDRDRRNGFSIPPRVTARALAGGLAHPGWSYRFARRPRIGWGNLPGDGGAAHQVRGAATLSAQTNRQFDPSATWDDLGWFRDRWAGRLVVKGILRAELRTALALAGCPSVHAIDASWVAGDSQLHFQT